MHLKGSNPKVNIPEFGQSKSYVTDYSFEQVTVMDYMAKQVSQNVDLEGKYTIVSYESFHTVGSTQININHL